MKPPALLSVVMPARNEEHCIEATLTALSETLEANAIPYEIIVTDDHSTDGTPSLLRSLQARLSALRSVQNIDCAGFGSAVRAGLSVTKGDAIVIMMADGSDDPQDVVRYFQKLKEGYDCVFGSRFLRGSHIAHYPPFKYVWNRIGNTVLRYLSGTAHNDITNAFKMYRKSILDRCAPFRATQFDFAVELPMKALCLTEHVVSVPISWNGRRKGKSKFTLLRMIPCYIRTMCRTLSVCRQYRTT